MSEKITFNFDEKTNKHIDKIMFYKHLRKKYPKATLNELYGQVMSGILKPDAKYKHLQLVSEVK